MATKEYSYEIYTSVFSNVFLLEVFIVEMFYWEELQSDYRKCF